MTTEESYPKLISLAVHELRTPASVVGGYLRMLQRDAETPLGERHRRMVDEAEKSWARLVALIAELNDISKLDDGLIALTSKPLDLFELIGNVAEGVHEAEDRDVRLKAQGKTVGAGMTGDIERLSTAFAAIFRAILREKPGPCTVIVDRRIVQKGATSSAVIVVADDPSVQTAYDASPGIFDEKRGGVGLSLPIARRVIEAHGGRLWSPGLVTDPGEGGDRAARGAALITFPLRG